MILNYLPMDNPLSKVYKHIPKTRGWKYPGSSTGPCTERPHLNRPRLDTVKLFSKFELGKNSIPFIPSKLKKYMAFRDLYYRYLAV